jgi:hypothetical protein
VHYSVCNSAIGPDCGITTFYERIPNDAFGMLFRVFVTSDGIPNLINMDYYIIYSYCEVIPFIFIHVFWPYFKVMNLH